MWFIPLNEINTLHCPTSDKYIYLHFEKDQQTEEQMSTYHQHASALAEPSNII